MAKIHDDVYDNGLSVLSADADELWILSGADEPADYAAALAVRCGVKDAPEISEPEDGAVSGRRVIVGAFSDGLMTADATGTRWGLVDTVGQRLLTIRKLTAPKEMYTGGVRFALEDLSITVPDPLPETE